MYVYSIRIRMALWCGSTFFKIIIPFPELQQANKLRCNRDYSISVSTIVYLAAKKGAGGGSGWGGLCVAGAGVSCGKAPRSHRSQYTSGLWSGRETSCVVFHQLPPVYAPCSRLDSSATILQRIYVCVVYYNVPCAVFVVRCVRTYFVCA